MFVLIGKVGIFIERARVCPAPMPKMTAVCPLPIENLIFETERAWVFGFKQATEPWFKAREMAVGGSSCAAHLGKSKYNTKHDAIAGMICARKIPLTVPMARGNAGEKYLRDHVSKLYGIEIQEVGMCIKKDAPWMRASPDGIYRLPDGSFGIVEFKVVSSRKNSDRFYSAYVTLTGGRELDDMPILPEHVHQINYTAGILGAVEMIYAVLVWEFDSQNLGKQPPFIYCAKYRPDMAIFEKIYVPAAKEAYEIAAKYK